MALRDELTMAAELSSELEAPSRNRETLANQEPPTLLALLSTLLLPCTSAGCFESFHASWVLCLSVIVHVATSPLSNFCLPDPLRIVVHTWGCAAQSPRWRRRSPTNLCKCLVRENSPFVPPASCNELCNNISFLFNG